MSNAPDKIVTVHINGVRYRGAYKIRGSRMVVTAYGLEECSNDVSVLSGESGKAELNLAKLMLVQMVKSTMDVQDPDPGLSMQGSTTVLCC